MEKEFVTYELALRMKQLGFNKPCFARFSNDGDLLIAHTEKYIISNGVDRSEFFTLAPTWQQAFRWFRKMYQLHSTITSISQDSWQWHITKPGESLGKLYDEDFYTYEEAELFCLEKLIEIVESKSE